MKTMKQVEDRLTHLKQQYTQLSQEIQNLDSIRQQAVGNLIKLEGAIGALENVLQEPALPDDGTGPVPPEE